LKTNVHLSANLFWPNVCQQNEYLPMSFGQIIVGQMCLWLNVFWANVCQSQMIVGQMPVRKMSVCQMVFEQKA
jgi:hypothetical protein